MWRGLLGAPPLIVVEHESNSNSTGAAEGAWTETAGDGGIQGYEDGTPSISTAADQLSRY